MEIERFLQISMEFRIFRQSSLLAFLSPKLAIFTVVVVFFPTSSGAVDMETTPRSSVGDLISALTLPVTFVGFERFKQLGITGRKPMIVGVGIRPITESMAKFLGKRKKKKQR